MSKRVHEIAKERGLAPKELLQRLQAAGLKVKAVSSSVDEADALRVLGNGGGDAAVKAEVASREAPPAQRGDGAGERPAAARAETRGETRAESRGGTRAQPRGE